ncbi:hypothetical protein HCN44_008773 [Aphidius gifuensis]|uniref:Chitin-binding type-2 domain-containing protein n=1 Tax=Aphidius gifuensis TaxID=684658 RepID=A0A834XSM7_APHGI|nr:hypothetical protein HCN44_008773 [Aphidius gifuensis]
MWSIMLRCIVVLSFLVTTKGQSYDLSDDELVDRVNFEVENLKPSRKRADYNEQLIHQDNQENIYSVPSQYLEPPAKFYSRSINDFPFEETSTDSTIKNQDLSTASSYDTSTIKTLKIYEITSFNSSTTYRQNHDDDDFETKTSTDSTENNNIKNNFGGSIDSSDSIGNKEKNTWKNDYQSSAPRDKINSIRTSFSRGNQRYQDNIGETINKKNNWQRPVNNWKEKSNQQINNYKFQDSGAAPGTPDYPINYEHIYYKLQNNNGRFPCPQKLTTHFYLADRLSRCQIFYVCYGNRGNGVPMICPNGTLFNEKLQVCDWWYNVTC